MSNVVLISPVLGEFDLLYTRWIENSLSGEIADAVFVAGTYLDPQGIMTLKISGQVATIGLFAVQPDWQGKGIGSKLIEWCEAYCFEKQVKKLRVATQNSNFSACKFYKKNGFELSQTEFIYHWWNK